MADTNEPLQITDDLIEATPIEKCSLNPRRGKNSRRLLTGFIIFASEARKEVADQYPNENFGFVSRLVGDKWRALSKEVKFKYHKRALIHNKRIKDLAQREGISLGAVDLLNGSHDLSAKVETPAKLQKMSKKKQAKLARRMEMEASTSDSPANLNDTTNDNTEHSYQSQTTQHQTYHQPYQPYKQQHSGTQTPAPRYVAPPPRKPLSFSEAFLQHLLQHAKSVLGPTTNTTIQAPAAAPNGLNLSTAVGPEKEQ